MAYFIFFEGPSNVRGAAPNADLHPSLTGKLNGCMMYNGSSYKLLEAGVNQSYPTPDTFHGAILSFAKNFQSAKQEDIYLAMYSVGGAQINNSTTGATYFPNTSGKESDFAISVKNASISYAWNNYGIRDITVIHWYHIGEADLNTVTEAEAIEQLVLDTIAKAEANFSGTGYTVSHKWIFQNLCYAQTYDPTNLATAIQAFENVAAGDPDNRIVFGSNYSGVMPDGHHFNASSFKTAGEDGCNLAIAKGW